MPVYPSCALVHAYFLAIHEDEVIIHSPYSSQVGVNMTKVKVHAHLCAKILHAHA